MSGDPEPDMFPEPRDYRGQRYVCRYTRPHVCRDGRVTILARWSSACADCGDEFSFFVPIQAARFEPNRRCHPHRRPGHRVKVTT